MASKKCYNLVADAVDNYLRRLDADDFDRRAVAFDLANEVASNFASDNVNFDRGRFMVACGFSSEDIR